MALEDEDWDQHPTRHPPPATRRPLPAITAPPPPRWTGGELGPASRPGSGMVVVTADEQDTDDPEVLALIAEEDAANERAVTLPETKTDDEDHAPPSEADFDTILAAALPDTTVPPARDKLISDEVVERAKVDGAHIPNAEFKKAGGAATMPPAPVKGKVRSGDSLVILQVILRMTDELGITFAEPSEVDGKAAAALGKLLLDEHKWPDDAEARCELIRFTLRTLEPKKFTENDPLPGTQQTLFATLAHAMEGYPKLKPLIQPLRDALRKKQARTG